jgi:polyisoprenoid-binding protein YceI
VASSDPALGPPGRPVAVVPSRAGRHARTRPGRRRLRLLGVVLIAALLVVGVLAVVRNLSPAGPGRTGATPAPATTPPPGWAGTWTVRSGPDSFLGYRIRQRVKGVTRPSYAAGRTRAVTGRVVLGERTIDEISLDADLRELASGDPVRDRWVAASLFDTGRWPRASITLRAAELGERPEPGAVVAARATGTLTMHGTTRPVVLDLEQRWTGDTLELVGRSTVRPGQFGIDERRTPGGVGLDGWAVLELRLRLDRA